MTMMEESVVHVQWLGHAAFKITTSAGYVILVDPWLGNPKAPADAAQLDKVDAIAISHGHFDHIGDAVELAKKFDCKGLLKGAFDYVCGLPIVRSLFACPSIAIDQVFWEGAIHTSTPAPTRSLLSA